MAWSAHCDVEADVSIFIGDDAGEFFPSLSAHGRRNHQSGVLLQHRGGLAQLAFVTTPAGDRGVLTREIVVCNDQCYMRNYSMKKSV